MQAAMLKTTRVRRLFIFAQDLVHPGAANRALTAQGGAAILHRNSFDIFHFTLLFALNAICFFLHYFLLWIETTHFLYRKQKLVLVYHTPEGIHP